MHLLWKIQKNNKCILVHTYTCFHGGRSKTRVLSQGFLPRKSGLGALCKVVILKWSSGIPQLSSMAVWHWKSCLTTLDLLFPYCEVQALDIMFSKNQYYINWFIPRSVQFHQSCQFHWTGVRMIPRHEKMHINPWKFLFFKMF